MQPINILVIGSGGREHALIWKLKQSPNAGEIYTTSQNAGILQLAKPANLGELDGPGLGAFCKQNRIGFVVVGPEAPLVAGVADAFGSIPVFGPSAKAAQLEGSKAFMKDFCRDYHIPTAFYQTFTDRDSAIKFVKEKGAPIVVKADGLAAGKGVTVAMTEAEAVQAIDEMLGGKFGEAGQRLVIEEFLEGEEVSFFALCDGKTAIPFGEAQDHKRAFDHDQGPNTGGMGTYSPAPVFTPEIEAQVMREIIDPTMKGMAEKDMPFKGVLFAGLMIHQGKAKLLEFNVRFGDPETQSLMMRLDSDLLELLLAASTGNLTGKIVSLTNDAALCVVMAAKGYPDSYEKGTQIKGLERVKGVQVFHAGTLEKNGEILANGGRVLGVAAKANTIAAARELAYNGIGQIEWPEGFCRSDIGWRAI